MCYEIRTKIQDNVISSGIFIDILKDFKNLEECYISVRVGKELTDLTTIVKHRKIRVLRLYRDVLLGDNENPVASLVGIAGYFPRPDVNYDIELTFDVLKGPKIAIIVKYGIMGLFVVNDTHFIFDYVRYVEEYVRIVPLTGLIISGLSILPPPHEATRAIVLLSGFLLLLVSENKFKVFGVDHRVFFILEESDIREVNLKSLERLYVDVGVAYNPAYELTELTYLSKLEFFDLPELTELVAPVHIDVLRNILIRRDTYKPRFPKLRVVGVALTVHFEDKVQLFFETLCSLLALYRSIAHIFVFHQYGPLIHNVVTGTISPPPGYKFITTIPDCIKDHNYTVHITDRMAF
jgi:hypothetical protein